MDINELKKRVQVLKSQGVSDEEINRTLKAGGVDPATVNPTQTQTQGQTHGLTFSNGQPAISQQPQKEGFIKGTVRAIIQPAVDYGKMVGGAGYEVVRGAASALGDKNAYNEQIHKNPFLSNEELAKFSPTAQGGYTKPILEGTKRTAGAMSYAVPASKAAKGAGVGTRLLNATKTGAKVGGLYGFSQSKETNPEELAIDTATGALTGAGTAGALGVVGEVANKAKGANKSFSRGIVNPQIVPNATAPDQQQKILNALDKQFGINTGTASQRLRKVNDAYNQLSGDVKKTLENSSQKVRSYQRLSSVFKQDIADNGEYFVPGDSRYETLLNRELSLLGKKAKNGQLSAAQLFEFKNELGNKLTNAFRKENGDLNSPVTDVEGVRLDLWRRVDNLIATMEPKVKDATQKMSLLHQAAPGLYKSSTQKSDFSPAGINMNEQLQWTGDKLSRVTTGVGNLADKIPAKGALTRGTTMLATDQAIGGNSTGQNTEGMDVSQATLQGRQGSQSDVQKISQDGQWYISTDGNAYSMDKQWKFDTQANDWVANPNAQKNDINPQAPYSLQEYNKQLSSLAGNSSTAAVRQYGLIKQERDYYYPQESGNAGGGKSETALNVLDQLQGIYQKVQAQGLTAQNPLLGRLTGAAKGNFAAIAQTSPEAANYSDQSAAFLSLLSRGLGEVGVLTDPDIERVRRALPKYSDTPEKAAQGWETVRTILKEAAKREAKGNQSSTNQNQGMSVDQAVLYPQ